jgi:glycosyltransferase involved in cell wall biosynthesis
MKDADVIVLPSREEGFGLVAVEAALLEVPFVGSRVGGLAEVCALLGQPTFSPGDERELASLIAELVDRPTRASPGVAEFHFSPSRIAGRYLALATRVRAVAG